MKIRYFAWVRERIGLAEEEISPPKEIATVGDLLAWLKTRGEGYESALAEPSAIRVALDQVHARPADPLSGAREVALFPPMTGG